VLLEALDHASFLEEKWWRGEGRSPKQEQTFKSGGSFMHPPPPSTTLFERNEDVRGKGVKPQLFPLFDLERCWSDDRMPDEGGGPPW